MSQNPKAARLFQDDAGYEKMKILGKFTSFWSLFLAQLCIQK